MIGDIPASVGNRSRREGELPHSELSTFCPVATVVPVVEVTEQCKRGRSGEPLPVDDASVFALRKSELVIAAWSSVIGSQGTSGYLLALGNRHDRDDRTTVVLPLL